MATKENPPAGKSAESDTARNPAGKGALTLSSLAGLATSCPWVIQSFAQNYTLGRSANPAVSDLPTQKPVKAGRRLH